MNLVVTKQYGIVFTPYEIGNKYIAIGDLTSSFFRNNIPIPIIHRIPINTSRLTSLPIIVLTQNENAIILMTDARNIIIVGSSDPNALNETVKSMQHPQVPDMSLYTDPNNLPAQLERMDLPPFDQVLFGNIYPRQGEPSTLSSTFSELVDLGRLPSFPTYLDNEIHEEENPTSQEFLNSYTALLKQLYNL